jgi:two-component system NtrC family sensor kinase
VQVFDRIILAGQVLVAVLLVVLLPQVAGPALPLYVLLGLTLLTLALQIVRLFRQRGRPAPVGTGLEQRLCQLLTEKADPATAIFDAVRLLQQETGLERVALFATDGPGRYAELLAEAQSREYQAASWGGRLAIDRLPALSAAVHGAEQKFWPDLAVLRLPPDSAQLLAAGHPALCLIPLRAGSAAVGFLTLALPQARRLPPVLQRIPLATMVLILALFIQRTGLQPDALRAQDLVELLYEVTTHLNTDLSLDKVMSTVLTQALAKVGATRGSIFLLDESNVVTHRILARENLAPEVSGLVIREIMHKGLAAWILEHRQGALIADVLQDSRWMVLPDHAGQVRSAVAVPFLRQDRVQGMLFLTHPEVGRFHQEHLDLLTSIANQASIAIQNARLYEYAENERRTLAAVLDSSADAIIVTDSQGCILLANRAAQQTVGVENRAAPLREVLLHPDLLVLLERAAAEEGTVSENVKMADGRTLSVSVAPVRDREGRTIGRVAAMHDITHMVELDEMKSRFVSTVSHDLKAPLTAIRGFAELIPLVGPVSEEQGQFVGRIKEVVGGMSHLISELLDLGKIEAGLGIELQSVNVRDLLVTSKYDLAMPAQENKIMIDIETPSSLPLVLGDPFRLQQVLSNLLGNAIKYTPRGGHVWMRAELRGSELVVSVSDTGIGIPPADLAHVFDKFYRVQDTRVVDQEGSGLGLAIVKSIIGEHGGRVWTESTLGKGSTFFFSLPLTPPTRAP